MNNLSIKIAGPAGFGIKVTGQILAKYFLRLGAQVFTYTEYPSLIRGGHNTFQVDVSDREINSASEKCDILIALNKEALNKELNNLNDGAIVICDESIARDSLFREHDNVVPAPLVEIAKNNGGELMKNTVALGALINILDLPLKGFNTILAENFGGKKEVVEQNKKALSEGYNWAQKSKINLPNTRSLGSSLKGLARDKLGNLLMTGNQSCALGALAAGCQFYSAYPMTPATEILHYLVAKEKETGVVVHQAEDEIAAIHASLGASFAGARVATSTSGGGFALMNEGLSLAGQLELPIVIFEVMRPAPATGLPTWTEQGDLKYVINAGHGEFARAVLAPGNPEQCFALTQKAFNWADKYQIPVFVLSDKFLGESSYSVSQKIFKQLEKKVSSVQYRLSKQNENLFSRYKITKNGVSPRTIPGVADGEYIANSDEHDEFGLTNEEAENKKNNTEKRMQKLAELKKIIPLPTLYGDKNAEITLVCWGSMLGPCLDAMSFCHSDESRNPERNFKKSGSRVKHGMTESINVLHFSHVYPLPLGLKEYLNKFKKLVLVENNSYGQLGRLIREETGIELKDKILKYDGRPFWKEEIIREIKKL